MQLLTLEYWRNTDLILTRYKFKVDITTYTKIALMVRTIFIFSYYDRFRTLIFWDQFKINKKIKFRYFIDVIYFWHNLLLISGLLCSLYITIWGSPWYCTSYYIFSPLIYSISVPYYSSISSHLNNLSVLKILQIRFLWSVYILNLLPSIIILKYFRVSTLLSIFFYINIYRCWESVSFKMNKAIGLSFWIINDPNWNALALAWIFNTSLKSG